jgi:hypothetical protein
MNNMDLEPAANDNRVPGYGWALRWAGLTIIAIPFAYIVAPSISALLLWISNAILQFGWSFPRLADLAQIVALLIGLSVSLGFVHSRLLKVYLHEARGYFVSTVAGWCLAALAMALIAFFANRSSVSSLVITAVSLVTSGAVVGAAQSIHLQRHFRLGYVWLAINTLAFSSLLLIGSSAESILEFVVILCLPGLISGFGMRTLLARSPILRKQPGSLQDGQGGDLLTRWRWFFIPASLAVFFVLATWGYAKGQLAVAKAQGVYSTPEQAILDRFSEGWGGANVLRIENVHAGPNNPNGSQPHVWFGGADLYLDRVPESGRRTHYVTGSFYVRVKDGWVYMPEGAFPTYVGWVMSLYRLEEIRNSTG